MRVKHSWILLSVDEMDDWSLLSPSRIRRSGRAVAVRGRTAGEVEERSEVVAALEIDRADDRLPRDQAHLGVGVDDEAGVGQEDGAGRTDGWTVAGRPHLAGGG